MNTVLYNIVLMNSISGEVFAKETAETIREVYNQQEENVRDQALAGLLFHDHIENDFSPEELERLEQKFLKDKRDLNMGERMALALSPEYLGIINVVELGRTENPSLDDEVRDLKAEYRDLLSWMQDHEWVEDEIPRSAVSRRLKTDRSDICSNLQIVRRARDLIKTTPWIERDNGDISALLNVSIEISKYQVCAIPVGLYEAIKVRSQNSGLGDNATQELIALGVEKLIDERSKFVIPIRTAYYLMADPLAAKANLWQ